MQLGEECDDANTEEGDGCDSECHLEISVPCGVGCVDCGNGVVESNEECDDANQTSGDGCSKLCALEPRFTCPIAGEACVQCGTTDASPCTLDDAGLSDAMPPDAG